MSIITFYTLAIFISVYAVIHGAIYGRIDGGGFAKVSEWVERTLVMFYFVIVCIPFAGLYGLSAYLGVVGIATGHGQYFLARVAKYLGKTKERVDPIVKLVFGKDPRDNEAFKNLPENAPQIIKAMEDYGMTKLYWRCAFGMFVTGTLLGIPAAILAIIFKVPLLAIPFALTGIVKALSYVICYELFKNTESAEYANGGSRTALCVVAALMYIFVYCQLNLT